jgi:hypothetical protein
MRLRRRRRADRDEARAQLLDRMLTVMLRGELPLEVSADITGEMEAAAILHQSIAPTGVPDEPLVALRAAVAARQARRRARWRALPLPARLAPAVALVSVVVLAVGVSINRSQPAPPPSQYYVAEIAYLAQNNLQVAQKKMREVQRALQAGDGTRVVAAAAAANEAVQTARSIARKLPRETPERRLVLASADQVAKRLTSLVPDPEQVLLAVPSSTSTTTSTTSTSTTTTSTTTTSTTTSTSTTTTTSLPPVPGPRPAASRHTTTTSTTPEQAANATE